jgi:aspartyl-tRNA(Asn)/glutamyl-tRNA(Gln) amidotransferase subunit B
MEEGSMRCDINVSVRPVGSEELRERCEIKNVNSRRFARKALEYEASRQVQLWESGATVVRQTMQFNPESGMTIPIRQKESAHDYRYFPDPDLPPLLISVRQLEQWRESQPILPRQVYTLLKEEKSLSDEDIQVLIDHKETAQYYLELTHGHPALNKPAANWIIQTVLPYVKEHRIQLQDLPIPRGDLITFLEAVESKKIMMDQALQLWSQALSDTSVGLPSLLSAKLDSVSRVDPRQAIAEVFEAFPEEATAFKGGRKKLLGFFLGEIKKKYPDCNIQEIQQTLAKT